MGTKSQGETTLRQSTRLKTKQPPRTHRYSLRPPYIAALHDSLLAAALRRLDAEPFLALRELLRVLLCRVSRMAIPAGEGPVALALLLCELWVGVACEEASETRIRVRHATWRPGEVHASASGTFCAAMRRRSSTAALGRPLPSNRRKRCSTAADEGGWWLSRCLTTMSGCPMKQAKATGSD